MSEFRYGCHNKPRPNANSTYIAQKGWSLALRDKFRVPHRIPIFTDIKSAFGTTTCQYDASCHDKGCTGCTHAAEKCTH